MSDLWTMDAYATKGHINFMKYTSENCELDQTENDSIFIKALDGKRDKKGGSS